MKAWSDDHPKAKLMARKRGAILGAAQDAFLRVGYEGASMESISAAAGVSIMTLYRHAKSKDELFAAVILHACDFSGEKKAAAGEELMRLSLREALIKVGELFQQKLNNAQTIALLRAVMMETARFPHLADAAYQGFVKAWQDNLDGFLAPRPELRHVKAAARSKLLEEFFSSLVGADVLRVLLGLDGLGNAQYKRRAAVAADRFLAQVPQ